MKQPDFWFRQPGALSAALAPLSAIWEFGTRRRLRKGQRAQVGIPVICVGNLNIGGTGKTPVVIELAKRLREAGASPHAVSKGHGGNAKDPVRIDASRQSAADVGDEPLLLSAFAPTWVGSSRRECALLAAKAGADAIILDDGHQEAAVHCDFSVIVVDAGRGFGNGRVVPSGPLREPIEEGLRRADALIAVECESPATFREKWGINSRLPIIRARTKILPTGINWKGERVLAFAGIGDPGKFFLCLRQLGANVVRETALSDHQPLDERILSRLERTAKSLSAELATTEKDAVRLPKSWRNRVLTLPVRLEIEDWSDIDLRLSGLGLPVPGASRLTELG